MSDFITTLKSTTLLVNKQIKTSTASKVKSVIDNFAANDLSQFIESAKEASLKAANMGLNETSVNFEYNITCSDIAKEALETLGFEVQLLNSSPPGHKEHWYFNLRW